MDLRVSADEVAAFRRCQRQWDFASPRRRNLTPAAESPVGLVDALRAALAVYYYPGMWDWDSAIVLPLVRRELHRAFESAQAPPDTNEVEHGLRLLEQYVAAVPALDDFCPLLVESDVEAILLPETHGVRYTDRLPLVVLDGEKRTWVVLHHLVPAWLAPEVLALDERAAAACWVWEETFLGVEVAGTIHLQILDRPDIRPVAVTTTLTGRAGRGGYAQHQPSGGGHAVPSTPSGAASRPDEVVEATVGGVRRTRVPRSRDALAASRRRVEATVAELLETDLRVLPNPSPDHCPGCSFLSPCALMSAGRIDDFRATITAGFRDRTAQESAAGRLGSGGGIRYLPVRPQQR